MTNCLGLHNKNIAYVVIVALPYRRVTENTEEGNLFVSADTLTGVYHFPILFIQLPAPLYTGYFPYTVKIASSIPLF